MKNLIIIPAYNEQESIEKTVEDIKANAPSFDYIVVNDCSKDNTGKICSEKKYNVIHLPVNLGIGGAVQTGYLYAWKNGYETAVQVDGDGQHDPKFLEMMLTYLKKENADMVIGSRFITKEGFQSSGLRRVGIRYFTWLIHLLTGKIITDPTSGLRMVNRSVIGSMLPAIEGLSGAGECRNNPEGPEKSRGSPCHYERESRRCFVDFSNEIRLLHDQGYSCDFDRKNKVIIQEKQEKQEKQRGEKYASSVTDCIRSSSAAVYGCSSSYDSKKMSGN